MDGTWENSIFPEDISLSAWYVKNIGELCGLKLSDLDFDNKIENTCN